MTNDLFKTITDPAPDQFGDDLQAFLQSLEQPTHIKISGKTSGPCRAVVTLLHGNEPSGLSAILHLIKNQIIPHVDTHFFIPNVEAARQLPEFTHRNILDERDLNRCFKPPYEDKPGKLAKSLLDNIMSLEPEAVIDVHNTSGTGPSFGVSTFTDKKHDALFAFFTQRVIITDLKLGALMELSEFFCPTVTIECGGAQDEESRQMAIEGLSKFVVSEDVLTPTENAAELDYYFNPIRLELKDKENGKLSYGDDPSKQGGLTLKPDIERFNFNSVGPDDSLGFLEAESLDDLVAIDAQGLNQLHKNFQVKDGQLYPSRHLKFFMITTNAAIARSDCLLYFTEAHDA